MHPRGVQTLHAVISFSTQGQGQRSRSNVNEMYSLLGGKIPHISNELQTLSVQ